MLHNLAVLMDRKEDIHLADTVADFPEPFGLPGLPPQRISLALDFTDDISDP